MKLMLPLLLVKAHEGSASPAPGLERQGVTAGDYFLSEACGMAPELVWMCQASQVLL